MRQFTRSAKHLPALALFAAVSTAAATGPSRAHSQASPGRLLRPDDYFGLESVGRPAISPDGSQVAFVRTRTLRDEDRPHDEIWIVPSDGSAQPRRLTSPAFSAADPRWSPRRQATLVFPRREPRPGILRVAKLASRIGATAATYGSSTWGAPPARRSKCSVLTAHRSSVRTGAGSRSYGARLRDRRPAEGPSDDPPSSSASSSRVSAAVSTIGCATASIVVATSPTAATRPPRHHGICTCYPVLGAPRGA